MKNLNSKKIIFIHLNNDFSGSTKVLSDIVDVANLSDLNIKLHASSSHLDGFLSNKKNIVSSYFYKRFDNKFLTLVSYAFPQVILFFQMLKYLRVDCIFYINTMMPFGAALAAKLMSKYVIFHIHETSIQKSLKLFLRFIIKHTASELVYVSKHLAQNEEFKGIKSKIVYNSLSRSLEIAAKGNNYIRPESSFLVSMICSLKDYKGINELIEISKYCKKNNNINFELILNANSKEITKYFKNKDVADNIKIYTKQSDLVPFYKRAQLVLNLSRIDQWIETFGLTILEAMAFGIPVIVPPVGGPTEIVRNEIDGFQISSYKTKEIAKKIIELSENHDLCHRISKNCIERSYNFSFNAFEKKIIEIIC